MTENGRERQRVKLRASNLAKSKLVRIHHREFVGLRAAILEDLLREAARQKAAR